MPFGEAGHLLVAPGDPALVGVEDVVDVLLGRRVPPSEAVHVDGEHIALLVDGLRDRRVHQLDWEVFAGDG